MNMILSYCKEKRIVKIGTFVADIYHFSYSCLEIITVVAKYIEIAGIKSFMVVPVTGTFVPVP